MNTINTEPQIEESISRVMSKLFQHTKTNPHTLARALGFPPPTINRILNGEVKDPRASTLLAIAKYFHITVDQLLGKEFLPGKFTSGAISKPPMSIPILNMNQAVNYQEAIHQTTEWFRWLPQNEPFEQNSIFALHIKNDLYQPTFMKDWLIIINTDKHPESGDYVLVAFTGETTVSIKKYLSEGRNKYLESINSDFKPVLFDSHDYTIIGIITEAYIKFK